MLLEEQIKRILDGEGELLEKALLGGKALIDYARDQLSGGTITVSINFPSVKKAEPAAYPTESQR
jgi:hypothetical protein